MTEDVPPDKNDREQPGRPPSLVPPDATAHEDQKPSRSPLMIVIGGLLLVIAALLVVFLPLMFEKQSTVQQEESQPASSLERPPPIQDRDVSSQDTTDVEAQEIEQLLRVWLQKQAEAEAVNVSVWGGDRYAAAVSLANECDKLLREEQYLSARTACDGAGAGRQKNVSLTRPSAPDCGLSSRLKRSLLPNISSRHWPSTPPTKRRQQEPAEQSNSPPS